MNGHQKFNEAQTKDKNFFYKAKIAKKKTKKISAGNMVFTRKTNFQGFRIYNHKLYFDHKKNKAIHYYY